MHRVAAVVLVGAVAGPPVIGAQQDSDGFDGCR